MFLSKRVHGKNESKKIEHKGKNTSWRFYLTVWAGLDDLPGLGVHVVAVELVGQRVVRSPPEHVEVPVEGHHGVPVSPLRRGRRAPQQVLRGDPCPAGTGNRVFFYNSFKFSNSILLHQETQHSSSTRKYYISQLKHSRITWILHNLTVYTYIFSLNSNWKRLLVIFAPLWPEKTNILSLQTATGKLQQEGGISPLCSIWKVIKFKIRNVLLQCTAPHAEDAAGPRDTGAARLSTWHGPCKAGDR